MQELIIRNYIEFRDGHARIQGRTLKAERVARMHLDAGAPIEEVMEHYGLTRAEVHAALAYYYENQQALDQDYNNSLQIGRESGAQDYTAHKTQIERRPKTR